MIDLHSHILPGIDDGAPDLATSLAMARMWVDQGVTCVACTPHILPGVYHNTGPAIRTSVDRLQTALLEAGIPLTLVTGADNHVVPDFADGLRRGHLLSLADTAYVLVEPPHHVAPTRIEDFFFGLMVAGYHPILTHPERLTWIEQKYDIMARLADAGVWMQITSGSIRGAFGRRPKYWAERMLSEGRVHILASDAHNTVHRRPDLAQGRDAAAQIVGPAEAERLVLHRPRGVLENLKKDAHPAPQQGRSSDPYRSGNDEGTRTSSDGDGSFGGRLRRFFGR
ncbi:MAG: CpsB/CapC family capsule biosynthesis tyrosine phosphatase [Hyphomicrobium sp.]|nr:CpsB/CapC family capsule biosynthesis tyrosine phosphatase [Hyphomicrobium sp.]